MVRKEDDSTIYVRNHAVEAGEFLGETSGLSRGRRLGGSTGSLLRMTALLEPSHG
jgi:hypothetical protein